MQAFPTESYLHRIGINSARAADEMGLRELHQAQCFSIPFENIEPFLSRPVSLEPDALWEKILRKGRGGYCFELNTLFLGALSALGFRARPVLGRVFLGRPEAGPRTHQASLVEINGRTWLADVGFGGPGLIDAIPFEPGFETQQQGRKIRLRADADWGMAYEDEFEGKWRTIYVLPGERVIPVDLALGNHYCANHPDSIFTNSLFCALPNASGRVTAFNRSVNLHSGSEKMERSLESEADLRWLLNEKLQLGLGEADIAAIQAKLPK